MFSHDLPTLEKEMEEAKQILKTNYGKFEELVVKYKIKHCSPFWDIACFLTLDEIENEKREEQWIKFWERNTKKQLYKNAYHYEPASFIQLSADEEIKKVFRKILEDKEKEEIVAEWENFLELFFMLRERTRPTLTKQEYNMLQEIVKNQTLSNIKLKENTGLDLSNISKYKKKLIEKGVIHQGITYNPTLLGLRIYLVDLIFPANYTLEIKKVLENSVFYRKAFENIDNMKTYSIMYMAPEEERTEKYLENLCKKIAEEHPLQKYKIYKLMREKRKISMNYENYDIKTKTWTIREKIVEMIMKKYPNNNKEKVTLEIKEFEERKKENITLTKESIDVFNSLIKNVHASTKQRAEELGIKETEIKKQLDYLYDKEIVKGTLQCLHIFGRTTLLMHIEEKGESQDDLHNFFSIYPEIYTEPYETKDSKGISILIRCPYENLGETQDIVNYRFNGQIDQIVTLKLIDVNRSLLLPEKYNVEQQKWEFTEEDIIGRKESITPT